VFLGGTLAFGMTAKTQKQQPDHKQKARQQKWRKIKTIIIKKNGFTTKRLNMSTGEDRQAIRQKKR
jgi:hypothetical protein